MGWQMQVITKPPVGRKEGREEENSGKVCPFPRWEIWDVLKGRDLPCDFSQD